jgi:hypothetical protein
LYSIYSAAAWGQEGERGRIQLEFSYLYDANIGAKERGTVRKKKGAQAVASCEEK